MTLIHLFLVHRYKASSVHYVSPTDDNRYQAQKMKAHGLFSDVHDEVGQIIVAEVSAEGVKGLLAPDRARLGDSHSPALAPAGDRVGTLTRADDSGPAEAGHYVRGTGFERVVSGFSRTRRPRRNPIPRSAAAAWRRGRSSRSGGSRRRRGRCRRGSTRGTARSRASADRAGSASTPPNTGRRPVVVAEEDADRRRDISAATSPSVMHAARSRSGTRRGSSSPK